MRSCFILVVSFLIIGCADVRLPNEDWPASVHQFHGVDSDQQSLLIELVDDINTDAGRTLVRVGGSVLKGYPFIIEIVDEFPGHPSRVGYAKPRPDHCVIQLLRRLMSDIGLLKSVFLHEIGHCGGLRHTPESDKVMSSHASRYSSFSSDTLKEFFRGFASHLGLGS